MEVAKQSATPDALNGGVARTCSADSASRASGHSGINHRLLVRRLCGSRDMDVAYRSRCAENAMSLDSLVYVCE